MITAILAFVAITVVLAVALGAYRSIRPVKPVAAAAPVPNPFIAIFEGAAFFTVIVICGVVIANVIS